MHVSVSTGDPWQAAPPLEAEGLSHSRDLDLCPPPHVAEHGVQLAQNPQPPLTGTEIKKIGCQCSVGEIAN